ncbi:hypothetical protein [Microbacterium lacus]|uniref:Phage holin family protein n=1 Tax=Microbacterium lacus TaxID=415217 RepID=A0ABN2GAQ8_9MICO
MAGQRPGGVTLVAVIAWISGAVQIIGAVISLLAGGGGNAWVALIVGILTIAVSLGLFRGNNVARILLAILFVLNLVVAVWALVIGVSVWSAIITGILAIIGLAILFSSRANAFFR